MNALDTSRRAHRPHHQPCALPQTRQQGPTVQRNLHHPTPATTFSHLAVTAPVRGYGWTSSTAIPTRSTMPGCETLFHRGWRVTTAASRRRGAATSPRRGTRPARCVTPSPRQPCCPSAALAQTRRDGHTPSPRHPIARGPCDCQASGGLYSKSPWRKSSLLSTNHCDPVLLLNWWGSHPA